MEKEIGLALIIIFGWIGTWFLFTFLLAEIFDKLFEMGMIGYFLGLISFPILVPILVGLFLYYK